MVACWKASNVGLLFDLTNVDLGFGNRRASFLQLRLGLGKFVFRGLGCGLCLLGPFVSEP